MSLIIAILIVYDRNFKFQISIDERGIVLFAFHGKINKEIQANEVGDFHGESRTKSNGWWSYENNDVGSNKKMN